MTDRIQLRHRRTLSSPWQTLGTVGSETAAEVWSVRLAGLGGELAADGPTPSAERWVVWYRPGRGCPWREVGSGPSREAAAAMIGTGDRRHGDWRVAPAAGVPAADDPAVTFEAYLAGCESYPSRPAAW